MTLFLLPGLLLAIVLAVITWRRGLPVPVVVGAGLALLGGGAPAYFFASFSAGMSLADTYMISGADVAPWGSVLGIISALACLALAGRALLWLVGRGRWAPAPSSP